MSGLRFFSSLKHGRIMKHFMGFTRWSIKIDFKENSDSELKHYIKKIKCKK